MSTYQQDNVTIVPRYNPNFIPVQTVSPDRGFISDTKDEFMLSWLGQLIQNNFVLDQKIYKEKPYDPTYNVLDDLEGFEQYIQAFNGVKNKEHANFIKQKITMNLERRSRLEGSDRVWGPALTAMLLDPVTYIPIPLAKGIGFTSRFVKGGAIGTGLIGGTELIRRPQDPTSSNAETAMILGGSFLMSGLFAGALGKKIGNKETPGLSKETQEAVKEQNIFGKVVNDHLVDQHEFNGHQNWEDTGFFWNISDAATTKTKVVIDHDWKLVNKIPGGKGRIPTDPYARYDTKTDTMYLNELKIFSDITNGIEFRGVNFLPSKAFSHPNRFKAYAMEVAVEKAYHQPWKKFSKKNPKATRQQWEAIVRNTVYEQMQKREMIKGGDDLNRFNWLANTWRKWTSNVVRSTGAVDDNQWYSFVLRGFADYGVKQRHNAYDVNTPASAITMSGVEFKVAVTEVRTAIQTQYQKKYGMSYDQTTNTMGINPEIKTKQAMDLYDKGRAKFTKDFEMDELDQTLDEFSNDVTRAAGSDIVFEKSDKFTKAAARQMRAMFKRLDEENQKLNLYDTAEAFTEKVKNMQVRVAIFKADLKKVKNKEQLAALQKNIDSIENKIALIKKERKLIEQGTKYDSRGFLIQQENVLQRNYIPLYPHFPEIMRDPTQFQEDWVQFLGETTMIGQPIEVIKKRAKLIYEGLVRTSEMGEDANILGIKLDEGTLRVGASNFMRRSLGIDYEALPDSVVAKYYNMNAFDISLRYANSVVKAQQMAKAYGDPFAELAQHDEFHRLTMKFGATKKGRANVREALQKFDDLVNRYYMTFNTTDPSSWTKQTVEALKDYTSLVAMGGALVSNLTEIARIPMAHGFEKAFPLYKAYITQNMSLFRKVLKQVHLENGEPLEVALGAMNRFIQDLGYTGQSGKLGSVFDMFTRGLKKIQVPYYWANGLTPWTIFWKNFSSTVSSHGIMLDSIKVATGKNPITKRMVGKREMSAIISRLNQHGINSKNAKLIASMPYEREGNLLLANSLKWETVPGGKVAREKFKIAMHAQTENTIITPMVTDTPNIIGGAITLTSDEAAAVLKNPLINKIIKPVKTKYGYKINMTWGSLPFQFMPWAFAATNKMIIGGAQALRDGEREVLSWMLATFTLGGMVAYMKNPYGVQNMSKTELALEAVERSGLLGLIPDINYAIETTSQGFTGEMVGVRPLIGALQNQDIGPRYGEPDPGDAVGEILGPGPSVPIDIIRILTGSYDYNTKHDMIRLMLPFQNLIGIEHLLKPMYSEAIERTIG